MNDVRLCCAALAAGVAATGAFLLAPSGSVVEAVWWSVPFTLAPAVLAARVRVSPPQVRRPLLLLLAGQLLYLVASVVWYVGPVLFGLALPFPSLVDVAYFGAYGLYAGFLLALLRCRRPESRLEGRLALTDAAILTLAVSAVLWLHVVEPSLANGSSPLATGAVVLYLAFLLLLFALAARLAVSNGPARAGVDALLFVWIGGELLADVAYGVQSANGTFSFDGPLIPVWMLAYTAAGAFAAHPQLVGFLRGDAADRPPGGRGERPARPRPVPPHARLVLLLVGALVPFALDVLSDSDDVPLTLIAAGAVTLALYRASLLSGDVLEQRRLQRELAAHVHRLDQAQRVARLGSWSWDAAANTVVWSAETHRILGVPGDVTPSRELFLDLVHPEDRAAVQERIAGAGTQRPLKYQARIVRPDGEVRWIEVHAELQGDEQIGETSQMSGTIQDVTERVALQRQLAAHTERLDDAQRLAGVGSFDRDLVTGREVWSRELYRILGHDESQEPSDALYLDRVHPEDRARVQRQITEHGPDRPIEYETRIVRPDGEVRCLAVRARITTDAEGVPVRKTGTAHDITERKAVESDLARLALTDTLTGLPNRDGFNAVLQSALELADGQRAVGLLLLDLDGFKDVNDGIGHHAGDLVLQEVACRVSSVLGSGGVVARLGGDEFAFVLPGIGAVENAIEVAATVRSSLEAPFDLDGIRVHVRASIGIVVSAGPTDPGALLKQADVAMYRAKALASGWAVFEPAQDDLAVGRLQMVTDLRASIDSGDLQVAYQPIVDTAARRVSSFEALARWHHPDKGVIPPDQFIPLAEQAGLIAPLTRLILRKAVAACAAWRSAGHELRVAVNVSVQVLQAEDVPAMVADALAHAGLDPQHLVLEITESSLATESEAVSAVLTLLRQLGVTLVIDDFGTGYSAMSYLKELPVEELKIDGSFVRDLATDQRDVAIVRSLIRLAHSLSLRVVAEGVESLAALEVLTRLGCDYAQGYGIARPMPEEQATGWLTSYDDPAAAAVEGRAPADALIVDDSPVVRARLAAELSAAGWRVRQAASAEEALAEVQRSIPDVVVLDHHLGGISGTQAVPHLRRHGVDGPILLFSRFLSDALPELRMPLDVWPVSKDSFDSVLELLQGYRSSIVRSSIVRPSIVRPSIVRPSIVRPSIVVGPGRDSVTAAPGDGQQPSEYVDLH